MTHAREKGSLSQSRSTGRRDNCPRRPHGETMGGAWPERSLRFGRTKKRSETKRGRGVAREMTDRRETAPGQNRKRDRRRDRKRDRKLYPLRGRGGDSEGEGLSCHVLLTRLEEDIREQESAGEREGSDSSAVRPSLKPHAGKGKGKAKASGQSPARIKPKTKSKPADRGGSPCVPYEPRKRRLASLNAEAVNSLLLERPSDLQPAAKHARRQQDEPAGAGAPPGPDPARGAGSGGPKALRGGGGGGGKVSVAHKSESCQSPKQAKRAKADRGEEAAAGVSLDSLHAPAPRRLAGLNAAALLKLTSSSASSKQRAKAVPTAERRDPQGQPPRPKPKPKSRQHKHKGRKAAPVQAGCAACKKTGFEPKVEWETGCAHRLTKPGYQSRSLLAYPLKPVKEEQVEAELGPYYCCRPEGSVEYCHRLALFLGQQAYRGERDDQPLGPAVASVKRECLVAASPPPPSLAHPHAALTLSPHPCLCAGDPCFSSYYVHIAHPAHAGAPSGALASRPLNFGAAAALCPNRVSGSKLLGPPVAHAQSPAFCGSVGSPCYSEACRVSGFAYRAVQPVSSRGCSFSTGCAGCAHGIKTEGYPSPKGDHAPSLLGPPSLPISSCPLPGVPPPSATQTKPRLLPPRSDHGPPPARLKLARECPQSAKPRNGSLSVGRTRLSQRQPAPAPALGPAKQKRVSRRRATNGWLPVGVPTEKEVFIAGDDETALRRCYEGVERDGEVIRVRDTVLLRSGPRKKSLPYVAKISALWEDPKTGELMMSLFWYYRPEHTQGGKDPSAHCENEIFASRHQDENSVACIEDRCYVLPLAQYCRFCALVKRRAEGSPPGSASVVPCPSDCAPPAHRRVPADIDPELVYLCRHVYDFRYGRILKNLQ